MGINLKTNLDRPITVDGFIDLQIIVKTTTISIQTE